MGAPHSLASMAALSLQLALMLGYVWPIVLAAWPSHRIIRQDTSDMLVIIDAGSTGTRVHLYGYPKRRLDAKHFPVILDSPLSEVTLLATFPVWPGISSYVNHTDGIPGSLAPLLHGAADAALLSNPHVDLKTVPVYLGATAGMRLLNDRDRDRVMAAVRAFLRSSHNPFSFARDEQARVLAGEEEGAFGWIATNRLHASIRPDSTTFGSIDIGGGSVEITFVPTETSILANFFPLHFGPLALGPIHLYSHSFLHLGTVSAWQLASAGLVDDASNASFVIHPCLPPNVSWHVDAGEFGASLVGRHPQRHKGPLELRGTGDAAGCQAMARTLIQHTACMQEPCSIYGVYQPNLASTKFMLLNRYEELARWEVISRMAAGTEPLLKALTKQMPRVCALPLATQEELFWIKKNAMSPCWRLVWTLTLLTDGFGFPLDSKNIEVRPDCCDTAMGHAVYEANYFPYRVTQSSYQPKDMSLVAMAASSGWTPPAAAGIGFAAGLSAALALLLPLVVSTGRPRWRVGTLAAASEELLPPELR